MAAVACIFLGRRAALTSPLPMSSFKARFTSFWIIGCMFFSILVSHLFHPTLFVGPRQSLLFLCGNYRLWLGLLLLLTRYLHILMEFGSVAILGLPILARVFLKFWFVYAKIAGRFLR